MERGVDAPPCPQLVVSRGIEASILPLTPWEGTDVGGVAPQHHPAEKGEQGLELC
jgi:hypothetical protein